MGGMKLSVYLLAPICAYILAQALKLILRHRGGEHGFMNVYHLYRSGGMPSAHTSVVVSLATVVGLKLGFSSVEFGIASIMAMVVIYDAMNVRYIVGEHGRIIAILLAEHKDLSKEMKAPKIIQGHTFGEVVGGTALGIAVALAILFVENS